MHNIMESDIGPILIVEDSEDDFMASKRVLKKIGINIRLKHCIDGIDAYDFLYKRNAYAELPASLKPSIIMLDLNMPGMDGRDLLQKIKSDQGLKDIPVVIFTTSNDQRDISFCYKNGANSYVQKPIEFEKYKQTLEDFYRYWFSVSKLPG